MDGEEAEWLGLVQPYQNVVSTLQYTEVRCARQLITFCGLDALACARSRRSHSRHVLDCLHVSAAAVLDCHHMSAAAVLHRQLQGAAPRQPGSREAAGAGPAVAVPIQ